MTSIKLGSHRLLYIVSFLISILFYIHLRIRVWWKFEYSCIHHAGNFFYRMVLYIRQTNQPKQTLLLCYFRLDYCL